MSSLKHTSELVEDLHARVENLETKVAFQDDTIESLNDSIAQQQQQIAHKPFKMNHMVERLKSMQPSNVASPEEETPPPHY